MASRFVVDGLMTEPLCLDRRTMSALTSGTKNWFRVAAIGTPAPARGAIRRQSSRREKIGKGRPREIHGFTGTAAPLK